MQSARKATLIEQMQFNRMVTLRLLDEIEKTGRADQVLRWSAGPGRAPIGWHFMHIASTEDQFASRMLGQKELISEAYQKEFSSQKQAGKTVPSLKEIRSYLEKTRDASVIAVENFHLGRSAEKPSEEAPFDYGTLLKILPFHEAHHQGQAQATFNLYKAK